MVYANRLDLRGNYTRGFFFAIKMIEEVDPLLVGYNKGKSVIVRAA